MKAQPVPPTEDQDLSALNTRLAIRCHDLQNQLTLLQHDHKLLIEHLYQIAEALGVAEEGFGVTGKGVAPSTILERIKELKGKP